MQTDEELFAAWHGGSQTAADTLCERYYWRVLRFFEVKQEWQAEDLTQRTFLACLERRADAVQNFRTYLFGVARLLLMRALRDHYTREKRRRFGESSALEHQTRLSGLAADREEHRLLLRALTELETETQIVLSLFYWENMSARELADMYSITHSAMRSRIARARDDLKAQLQTISVPVHVRASLMADLEGWARSVVTQGGRRRSMTT